MIHTTFERLYRARVAEAIKGIYEKLGSGAAKDSLYEYGRLVGTIYGLNKLNEFINEVSKTMGGSEKSIAAEMSKAPASQRRFTGEPFV